jgi:hypothetical protein
MRPHVVLDVVVDQERHAQRFLVHEALVVPAVIAQEEALV